jgi:hypothetical protein
VAHAGRPMAPCYSGTLEADTASATEREVEGALRTATVGPYWELKRALAAAVSRPRSATWRKALSFRAGTAAAGLAVGQPPRSPTASTSDEQAYLSFRVAYVKELLAVAEARGLTIRRGTTTSCSVTHCGLLRVLAGRTPQSRSTEERGPDGSSRPCWSPPLGPGAGREWPGSKARRSSTGIRRRRTSSSLASGRTSESDAVGPGWSTCWSVLTMLPGQRGQYSQNRSSPATCTCSTRAGSRTPHASPSDPCGWAASTVNQGHRHAGHGGPQTVQQQRYWVRGPFHVPSPAWRESSRDGYRPRRRTSTSTSSKERTPPRGGGPRPGHRGPHQLRPDAGGAAVKAPWARRRRRPARGLSRRAGGLRRTGSRMRRWTPPRPAFT